MPIPQYDPIVVAPTPTPFDDNDNVDYDALARNIERWMKTPLSGFVLGTANGEELALSEDEKVEIVRTVTASHQGQRFVIAGIDNPSLSETIRLAKRYADTGSDLIRVRVPRGLPGRSIEKYFGAVTANSPAPVIIIHQTFTGIPAASPEVLGEVCAYDNVFGYITDHDIRYEAYVRALVPENRRFWTCNGGLLSYGALMGANGACMWLGNVAPELCMNMMKLGTEGKFVETRTLQVMASLIDRTVIEFGTPGVKAALGILGFEGMKPRAPTPPVSKEQHDVIRKVLSEAGLTD